jgi:spore photoproduct lyase
MYNSAHIVIFVNLDDFFYHTEALLKEINSLFLCISYETDLLGFENIIPYTREWIEFAKKNPNLTIEIRTKSNNYKLISDIKQIQNVILAWTLSPETTIDKFENNTPTLNRRIESLLQAIDDGWNVRICLDPVLYSNNWEEEYTHFINYVFSRIDSSKVFDLTLGVFRINSEYLKNIRKMRTDSKLVFFPYKRRENFSTYPVALEIKMKEFIFNKLVNYLPKEKIFL